MTLLEWLNKDDPNFDGDLESLKALYEYLKKNDPDFKDSLVGDWIDFSANELNLRELAKKLRNQ